MKITWHHSEVPERMGLEADWTPSPGEPVTVWDDAFRTAWLPSIGPSSFCMARELSMCLTRDHTEFSLVDVGAQLGLLDLTIQRKTILRLCQFELARLEPTEGVLRLRIYLGAARRPRSTPVAA